MEELVIGHILPFCQQRGFGDPSTQTLLSGSLCHSVQSTAAHKPCKRTPQGKVIYLCIDTAEEHQRLLG